MNHAGHRPIPLELACLDGLVITVADLDRSMRFYQRVLGMQLLHCGSSRATLGFGRQRLTLTCAGADNGSRPAVPVPGSQHLRLLSDLPMVDVVTHLLSFDVAIEETPSRRHTGRERVEALSFRDPDGNLIEILSPAPE